MGDFKPSPKMTEARKQWKVFVSYRRRNLNLVSNFIKDLPPDLEIFIDINNLVLGRDWRQNIEEWMEIVDSTFLMITSDIFDGTGLTEAIQFEMNLCLEYGVPIIPIIFLGITKADIEQALNAIKSPNATYYEANTYSSHHRLIESIESLTKKHYLEPELRYFTKHHLSEIRNFLAFEPHLLEVPIQLASTTPFVRHFFSSEYTKKDISINVYKSLYQAHKHLARFILLGEPGSGKSFALHQLARDLLFRVRNGQVEKIPILLHLNSWKKPQTFEEFLRESFAKRYLTETPFSPDNLHKTNRFILLLDGLDEVLRIEQSDKVSQIADFMSAYSETSFIVTCRFADYNDELAIPKLIMKELTKEEITFYIANFRKTERTEGLEEAIFDDLHLFNMAKNPYLLSMICKIYESAPLLFGSIKGQGHLFHGYVELMLEENSKRFAELDKRLLLNFLSKLACAAFWEGKVSFDSAYFTLAVGTEQTHDFDFLLNVARSTYLLRFNPFEKTYSFPHLFLRNYFAAYYMSDFAKIEQKLGTRIRRMFRSPQKVDPRGIHLQVFAFQDFFPAWETWPYSIIASKYDLADLSQEINLSGASIDSLIDALFTSQNMEIVNVASRTLRNIQYQEIFSLIVERLDGSWQEIIYERLSNQIIFCALLDLLYGIKQLIQIANRLSEKANHNDLSIQQAMLSTRKYIRKTVHNIIGAINDLFVEFSVGLKFSMHDDDLVVDIGQIEKSIRNITHRRKLDLAGDTVLPNRFLEIIGRQITILPAELESYKNTFLSLVRIKEYMSSSNMKLLEEPVINELRDQSEYFEDAYCLILLFFSSSRRKFFENLNIDDFEVLIPFTSNFIAAYRLRELGQSGEKYE